MRIERLNISNFKTLADHKVRFADITILAGANSVGKSSTVQSILFLRSLIEKIFSKHLDNTVGEIGIPLNGPYMLSLGSTKEVISWETGRKFSIEVEGKNESYLFELEADDLELTNYFVKASFPNLKESQINLIRQEFYYLNAERLGPRIRQGVNENPNNVHCGYQGQYTMEVLARLGNEINLVSENKFLRGEKLLGAQTLLLYTRQWVTYIIPDTELGNAEIFGEIRSTSVKFNSFFSAPNVGFGVSYILPIIITGLIAKPASLFLIENPEAHLHPKGQSRVGYFLGCIAAAGVQVIIETHSEHIINGIRIAVMEKKLSPASSLVINFYNKSAKTEIVNIDELNMNEFGDLSSFPVDFFDQAQQDLLEIMKLSKR